MPRYKNMGGPHRTAGGETVSFGQIVELTQEQAAAEEGRWKLILTQSTPEVPEVPDEDPEETDTPPKAGATEPTVTGEGTTEPGVIVKNADQYHTGGGWYDIPGHGKVQGREAALKVLQAREEGG